MEDWLNFSKENFNNYVNSFSELTDEQAKNFRIKKEHSHRVADVSLQLLEKMGYGLNEQKVAFISALFHDIGRFRQLIEFNTFNDEKSIDHAEYSVKVLKEEGFLDTLEAEIKDIIVVAVQLHNKIGIPENLSEKQNFYSQLLRDADKLDILKVLTDYYGRTSEPNHTLTWELPRGSSVSPKVAEDILSGKLVSKSNVKSELDVKVMQMSWVYDLNFRVSFDYLMGKRFIEKIYNSMPKNDLVISIHRKIKVYSENKMLV